MSRQVDLSDPSALSDEDMRYVLDRGVVDQVATVRAEINRRAKEARVEEQPPADDDVDPYDKWKVDDLREECRIRGLSDDGKKEELVSRLEENDAQAN